MQSQSLEAPTGQRKGKTGKIRHWSATEITVLGVLAASIAVVVFLLAQALSSGRVSVFDAKRFTPGDWDGTGSLFVYHPEKSSLKFREDGAGLYLRFHSEPSEVWEGFGMLGNMSVPDNALLRMEWRNASSADRFISLFLTENSAGAEGRSRPENFLCYLLLDRENWRTTAIPMSQFVRNSWQETGASVDGVLNTDSIRRLEFGFGPGEASDVDIRRLEFVWDTPPSVELLSFPILAILACIFFLMFRPPVRLMPVQGNRPESRMSLALAILMALAASLSYGPKNTPEFFPLIILGLAILPAILDDVLKQPFQNTYWWQFRFVPACLVYLVSPQPVNLFVDLFFLPLAVIPFFRRRKFNTWLVTLLLALGVVELRRFFQEGSIELYPSVIIGAEALLLSGLKFLLHIRRQGQESLVASHLYQGVMALTQDMIFVLDESARVESMNRGAEQVLKMTSVQARGKPLEDLVQMKVEWAEFLEQLEGTTETRSMELQALDNWGGRTYYSIRIQRFPIEGVQSRFILILRDISAQKHLEEELRAANARLSAIAFLDGLTGIASRRAFDQALDLEWKRSRRNRYPLGLLLIDVDHFKAYNDSYGHLKGDDALRIIASCLKSFTRRPEDVCARYGGEEFVILFPGMPPENLAATAEGLRKAVEQMKIEHKVGPGWLTISIGGASSSANPSETTPSALIHNADTALYQAKNSGRNQAVINSLK